MKHKKMPKKLVPVFIAFICIILIAIIIGVTGLLGKYSYSNEQKDLKDYFQIYGENQFAILVKDDILEEKGLVLNGTYYLPVSMVQNYLNHRFFYDKNEQLLLYTTPTELIQAKIGENTFTVNGQQSTEDMVVSIVEQDIPYVALDFVKKFTNFNVDTYTENGPVRIQFTIENRELTVANIKKNTSVRLQGGVKSPILCNVLKNDEIIILEKMEKWSKVKTNDSIIGYVQNKYLINEASKEVTVEQTVEMPEYTSLNKEHKINMVWHLVTNMEANNKVYEMLEPTQGLNTITPTWFVLSDNDGNFTSFADKGYVDAMHERGLEVWAMLDNFTGKYNDGMVDTEAILSYTSKRTKLIGELMNQILAYGIDGINIDFEQVPREAGEAYIQFLRELSIACRQNGIVLSIDNYVPTEYTAYYNRAEQGIIADYIIVMGYDEHYSGSDIGSVASINFVEKGIQDTVAVVPSEKVINALPFYTAIWESTGENTNVKKVGMGAAANFMTENGGSATWDDVTCQNYTIFQTGDITYQIWLEDEQSVATKLNVMKNYNLGGVAGWRLGLEKPEVWSLISAYSQ